jgi:hypothetical protein
MSSHEPIRITFMRSRVTTRAFLIDPNLDLHSLEELRGWARRKKAFVIIDGSTGDDITRILLAHRLDDATTKGD